MKKLIALVVLGTSLSCSSMVMAEGRFDGLYLKGGLGYVMGIDERTSEVSADGEDIQFDFDLDSAASLSFAVGFKVNSYLTTEVSLQHNFSYDVSGGILIDGETYPEYSGDPDEDIVGSGDVETTALMVTALIDFAGLAESNWAVRPYAGLGIGFARNSISDISVDYEDNGSVVGSIDLDGGSDSGFAWKIVAGATFPINKNLAFDASYQYSDYGSTETGTNWGPVDLPESFKLDVKSHELMFALRYMF